MTREERHIAVLNRMLESMDIYDSILSTTERKKAIKAAIQALSQEPTDTWSIKEIADTFKKHGLIREQEPCDDAVSREDILIDLANAIESDDSGWWTNKRILSALRNVFSVTQKSGKWIELPKALNPNENPCKCSECGHVLSFMNCYPKSKYCPNCGAKMESDEKKRDTDDSTEKH